MIDWVPCADAVRVRVQAPIVHLCPHRDEVDDGEVDLEWSTVDGQTIELHSLRAYLDSWQGQYVSHEDLVARIKDDLDLSAPVSAKFTTAGMAVTVRSR